MKFDSFAILLALILLGVGGIFASIVKSDRQAEFNDMAFDSAPLTPLSPAVVATLGNDASAAVMAPPFTDKPTFLAKPQRIALGCYKIEASITPGWKPATFLVDDDGRVSLSGSRYTLDDVARKGLLARCQTANDALSS